MTPLVGDRNINCWHALIANFVAATRGEAAENRSLPVRSHAQTRSAGALMFHCFSARRKHGEHGEHGGPPASPSVGAARGLRAQRALRASPLNACDFREPSQSARPVHRDCADRVMTGPQFRTRAPRDWRRPSLVGCPGHGRTASIPPGRQNHRWKLSAYRRTLRQPELMPKLAMPAARAAPAALVMARLDPPTNPN